MTELADRLRFRIRVHECACGAVIKFLENTEGEWPDEWDWGSDTACGACGRVLHPTDQNTQVEDRG